MNAQRIEFLLGFFSAIGFLSHFYHLKVSSTPHPRFRVFVSDYSTGRMDSLFSSSSLNIVTVEVLLFTVLFSRAKINRPYMPAITRKVSSQQVAGKIVVEEQSAIQTSKVTTKTNKAARTETESDGVTNNKTTSTHASSREKSPIMKTPPPQKRSKNSNEDLLSKLAVGEETDILLQRRFRQSLGESGKRLYEKLSFFCLSTLIIDSEHLSRSSVRYPCFSITERIESSFFSR